MNTQLARPHDHDHQQQHHELLDPRDAGGVHTTTGTEGAAGEEHHHGGVKAVLKKVKQKAKKVKDTLKIHGGHHEHDHDHDHDHDHHNVPDDRDLDEEEDDDVDEEMIEDPAVHGASGHEAAVAAGLRSGVLPGKSSAAAAAMQPDYYDGGYSAADSLKMTPLEAGENRGGQGQKLADIKEEPLSPFNSPATMTTTQGMAQHSKGNERARAFVGQQEKDRGHPQITLEEDPSSPSAAARSPFNHQAKTLDRTDAGGEEAGVRLTLLESLEKAKISEEERHSQGNDGGLRRRTHDVASVLPAGSHDQFSPEATRPQNQSSYSEKISSATAVIADKAISAKNVVASKLGYGETTGEGQRDSAAAASESASPVEYGKKIAATVTEKLTPVYETVSSTVASAGNTVMSRVYGGGGRESTHDVATESEEERMGKQDKGGSVKEYLVEKLKPTEDDKALSDVISEAMPWRKTFATVEKEEEEEEKKLMGRVTESEEVKKRLGTGEERKREDVEVEGSSVSVPEVGGVFGGKLKGAVESWFGKGQ